VTKAGIKSLFILVKKIFYDYNPLKNSYSPMEPTILVCVINSFASYNQFTHFLQSELFFWCKKMTTVLFIIPSKNQGSQFRKLKAWLYKTIKKIQQVSLNLE